jgi:hypothetical protein
MATESDIMSNMGEKLTSDWDFHLELENGKRVTVGRYRTYCEGAAHANAALKATPRAEKWVGERVYVPLTSTEEMEA